MNDMVDALCFYAVFVFAVTVHEAAHALAAQIGGDPTAYNGGQVTIDPIPHIRREPFGMVVLPLIGLSIAGFPFGYASAPYDPHWARRYPRRAAWMALAGPGANLALVMAAAILIRVGMMVGWLDAPGQISFMQITVAAGEPTAVATGGAFLLSVFFSLNLLLFLFNLFPVPPLDGAGALPLLLPEDWIETYQGFASQPLFAFAGLFLVWQIFGEVFYPVLFFAIGLLYPEMQYG